MYTFSQDFATRALTKIDELSELENMSCDPSNSSYKKIFKKVFFSLT